MLTPLDFEYKHYFIKEVLHKSGQRRDFSQTDNHVKGRDDFAQLVETSDRRSDLRQELHDDRV